MALSDKNKANALRYLGWQQNTIVSGKVHFNSVVNDRLSDLSSEGEKQVKGILTRLENIDTCLDEAKCRLAASSVDNVKMNKDEIYYLRKERTRWIRELSDSLDIPVMRSGGVNVGLVS